MTIPATAPLSLAELLLLCIPFVPLAFVIGSVALKAETPWRAMRIVTASLLCALALYALWQAASLALELGVVSLPSRRGYPRPLVPWPQAWVYLLTLGLFLCAGVLALVGRRRLRGWSLASYTVAFVLLGVTSVFRSLRDVLAMTAFCVVVWIMFRIQRRYGTVPAVLAWAAVIALVVGLSVPRA